MRVTARLKPWSGRREALFGAALFLVIVGLYSLTWFQGLRVSVSAISAERVLRGAIPYRDFWTMYAPGHFYLLALLFQIFGRHLLVDTVAASVVCAAAGGLCYRLVFNLAGRRFAAIACAAIFVTATLNTGYFQFLGSYPPAIFFIVAALNLVVLHYNTEKLGYLIAAGLATGAAVLFKHDVGGYTAIAILAGLVGRGFLFPATTAGRARSHPLKHASYYCAATAIIVLPIASFFAVKAGADALRDLVIFPLTDFRYARPEHYPGIFEFNILGESFLNTILRLFKYLNFTLPFVSFLFGLIAIGVAVKKQKPKHVALGVTFAAAYLLHYSAAHVQVNTHIISMSIYGAVLGVIFIDLLERELGFRKPALTKLVSAAFVGVWFLSLAAEPADKVWTSRKQANTELTFEKVSGFKASPELSRRYFDLLAFVATHSSPNEKIFIGLHRHDVVIVGANAPDYFILDRPIATRYHELHPAVADTADVQREIIHDLQENKVSLIILKRVFSDEALEKVKRNFLKNLPNIGATDLDRFIRANYVQVRTIGNNAIWQRKDAVVPVAGSL
jgi:hypothetical protein